MTTTPFREGHLNHCASSCTVSTSPSSVYGTEKESYLHASNVCFALNYEALWPFASMVQVGNFTALQTPLVDVRCSNTVVYSYAKKLNIMYYL